MKQSFRTKLKQLWFPKAFRLPEPEFTKEQIDLLEELIQLIHPTISQAEMASKDEKLQMAHFLVDLGTGVWRIRRKIEGLTRMPKEIKDALYSLESTWMSMSEGGVEIVDHIGTIPSKDEAKIVEVREIPNLAREQVVDALKPTILLRGEVIQLGEVIMGRPAQSNPPFQPDAAPQEMPTAPEVEVAMQPEIAAAIEEEYEEPPVTHEVETLSMDTPPKIDEPLSSPIPEEPVQAEPPSLDELLGSPLVPDTKSITEALAEAGIDVPTMQMREGNAALETIEAEEPAVVIPEEPQESAEPLEFSGIDSMFNMPETTPREANAAAKPPDLALEKSMPFLSEIPLQEYAFTPAPQPPEEEPAPLPEADVQPEPVQELAIEETISLPPEAIPEQEEPASEPEEKPKRRRTPRKPKADTDEDDAKKPKRTTRKSKKSDDGPTEVDNVG